MKRFSKKDEEEAKLFFNNNGFVIIEDVFNEEFLNDFKLEAENIIKAHVIKGEVDCDIDSINIFDSTMESLEQKNHDLIASIYDTLFQCPSFLRIVSNKDLTHFSRLLLGNMDAPLYGYTNRCRIDPPRDERRTYGWHQEVFYTVPKGHYIQTWAPLIRNTTMQNGTIEVAVGSHKEEIANQTWNEENGRATQILIDKNIINKYEQKAVEMKLGELLLFSGYLAHRSGINTSKEHRYSLVGMYHDVSTKEFLTPSIDFQYRGMTPKEFYDHKFS